MGHGRGRLHENTLEYDGTILIGHDQVSTISNLSPKNSFNMFKIYMLYYVILFYIILFFFMYFLYFKIVQICIKLLSIVEYGE